VKEQEQECSLVTCRSSKPATSSRINSFGTCKEPLGSIGVMVIFVFGTLAYVRAFLITRHSLAMEAVTLRQQLAVYKRKQTRPKLDRFDRLFWVFVRRIWVNWSEALILVRPDTVVSWHRAGYRLFWKWRSRPRRVGRPKIAEEVRNLIRRMKRENPTWGAPRIHGELVLLGFNISEPTVSRYLQRLKRIPDESKTKQWRAFLSNHREAIAAFDFFTVPNLWFRTLYCFFVIEHARRRVLHFNVTLHPASDWIVQQLREAFPLPGPYRYVLFDHDSKFGNDVLQFLKSSALKPMRTSIRSPWQNGAAERWVGSARRELLDHIIPLNEYHVRRLGRDYLAYYHQDRTHIGLNKNTPAERAVESRSPFHTRIVSTSRLGGLHHRYRWSEAA
jgi:transposase InsO family protein